MMYNIKHCFARIQVDSKPSRWEWWYFIRVAIRKAFRIYYTEEEIVKDMLQWFWTSPDIVEQMVDSSNGFMYSQRAKLLGRLIRNEYGFWENRNPYTEFRDGVVEVKDGVIVDRRHPDNLSGLIVDKILSNMRIVVNELRQKGELGGAKCR